MCRLPECSGLCGSAEVASLVPLPDFRSSWKLTGLLSLTLVCPGERLMARGRWHDPVLVAAKVSSRLSSYVVDIHGGCFPSVVQQTTKLNLTGGGTCRPKGYIIERINGGVSHSRAAGFNVDSRAMLLFLYGCDRCFLVFS